MSRPTQGAGDTAHRFDLRVGLSHACGTKSMHSALICQVDGVDKAYTSA